MVIDIFKNERPTVPQKDITGLHALLYCNNYHFAT